jgi:drug/metabolite transporter (DMT)-like permease
MRPVDAAGVSTKRRGQVAHWSAIVGALIAAVGYAWVAAVSFANYSAFGPSVWFCREFGYESGPCIVVFAIGSVVLVLALAYIRAHSHPYVDGHFIWGSVGVGAIAVVMSFSGLSITNSLGGTGDILVFFSVPVGALALVVFAIGIADRIGRVRDQHTKRP